MLSDMMIGKSGRRSGVDKKSKFITTYLDFTYTGKNDDQEVKEEVETIYGFS
jgi:hypothetical protein